ncbi:hypothetical protein [Carboxylicivirga linearis]|uniref:DUF983 domain-containing protein n=1 Tax=Carboxylicivirga linearis TaxID=1628157 RepID=A0ABS5JWC3_9BACT|nr:hypothetical protein [Carboxylicivirga linearis]MBS2099210.1 hypothetical protein [Carboxylicivirga linearis]
MKLYTICKDCKKEIGIWTWATDRVELKMNHGQDMQLHCNHCKKTNDYLIEDLKAKDNQIAILIGITVFIIGTPTLLIFLWDYIWQSGLYAVFGLVAIIGIPSLIYSVISKNDLDRVRNFNRS